MTPGFEPQRFSTLSANQIERRNCSQRLKGCLNVLTPLFGTTNSAFTLWRWTAIRTGSSPSPPMQATAFCLELCYQNAPKSEGTSDGIRHVDGLGNSYALCEQPGL